MASDGARQETSARRGRAFVLRFFILNFGLCQLLYMCAITFVLQPNEVSVKRPTWNRANERGRAVVTNVQPAVAGSMTHEESNRIFE